MKKYILIIAAALAMVVSCKEPDYKQEIEDKVEAFSEYYMDVLKDTELSDDQKEEQINARYDQLGQEVEQIATAALKKHKDDSLAVYMVITMAQLDLTDGEGLLGLIEKLGPNAQADPVIQKIKSSYEKKSATAEGCKFLDFEAQQPDGKIVKLSDFAGKGQYCLVDFWASWCGPCKREIPNLIEVYNHYGKKGLQMVSVAVWDKPEDTVKAAQELGIVWNQIINAQQVPTDLYGIDGIPHILLIGPDGTILKRDLRGNAIQEELEKYF